MKFIYIKKCETDDLIYRLKKRAEIRRQIPTRKSVQNNEPDRIADLLEESAEKIKELQDMIIRFIWEYQNKTKKEI